MSKTTETPLESAKDPGIIHPLESRPSLGETILAALQHLMAIFVAIITPTLILSGPLELDAATTGYLVSMSLIISGVATFIQCRQVGMIGSGLLSIQGTSFAFIQPMIAAGAAVGNGIAGLAMIFGLSFAGSFIEMGLSRIFHLLRRVLTPVVAGRATLIMFGTVAAAGIKIISTQPTINSRDLMILAFSFGLGLGVQFVPDVLDQVHPNS